MNKTSPLIQIQNLTKYYSREHLLPSRNSREPVLAIDDITLSISSGTTLALVGESGSGKSTLALCLACLEKPTSGSISFAGRDLAALPEKELRAVRPQIQLVFQDPANSFNPSWTARQILAEPLILHQKPSSQEQSERIATLLQDVGLSLNLLDRYSVQLSGGQKQRLAIARALALQPKVLILDEVLSALDCSIQAQIANLLLSLQMKLGLTYLLITHDLTMAAHLADEIAVMHRGKIIERAAPQKLIYSPEHQVTQALLLATPKFPAPAATPQER